MGESSKLFISVVDDDESVRRALIRLLVNSGFTAEVFSSAQEFLNSAHLLDTECIILDLQMPGMSGLELQSHLAAAGYHIPIVFHASHLDDRVREQALQGGAVAVLGKPATDQDLLAAIDSAVTPRDEPDKD
jgi:FixJ family two-component response regulator